jgi:hypothetical protein
MWNVMPLSLLDSYQSVGVFRIGTFKMEPETSFDRYYLFIKPDVIESHKSTAFLFTAGVTSDLTKNVGLKCFKVGRCIAQSLLRDMHLEDSGQMKDKD